MAQDLTAKRTAQLPQTALSAPLRTQLASTLGDLVSLTTKQSLLTMTRHDLRSWVRQERDKIPPAATPAQIGAQLATLIPHYWQPDLSDAQMRSKFHDFYCDLEGVTVAGIVAAVVAYRRNPKSEYFPKPGPFRALCEDDIRERFKRFDALNKVEHLVNSRDDSEPQPDSLDDETVARRRAILEGALGRMPAAAEPVHDLPRRPRDERPISDELREMAARKRS